MFYVITTGFSANTQERAALLEAACRQRGISYATLESTTTNRLELPSLQVGDALYNATIGGVRLEESLWRPGVATFYEGAFCLTASKIPPAGYQAIPGLIYPSPALSFMQLPTAPSSRAMSSF